ncbi:DUF5937 family protein [Streptomyces lasalocidi]
MAELAFSANDLAQVRFAISPMWEVAPSFRLLASNTTHPVHRPWIEQVRPRVMAAGLDRGWLAELIGPSGYVPDFLTPSPRMAGPHTGGRVGGDLGHARRPGAPGPRPPRSSPGTPRPTALKPARRHARPSGQGHQEIATYWEMALVPNWARIRAVLEADIFHRARTVAEHGTGRLFNDLHTAVSWDNNALRLARRKRNVPRESAGTGLLLIPSAFTGPGLRTRVRPPDPPQLAYPARGVGALWVTRSATGVSTLASVLGRSRTLLLTELATPASTTELAHRTGLSPAGVSQYLTALRNAGLVTAHRAGRSVLYARTTVAETLLEAASR